MEQECKIVLENEAYYPGQKINGKVVCNFDTETKVRGIRVTFKGRAKVNWQEGRNRHYNATEQYFEMVSDLLLCETDIPCGQHAYPFTVDLPAALPPSVDHNHGNIRYTVAGTIDRPWAIDYNDKKEFKMCSYIDLNSLDEAKKPMQFTKTKRPFSVFSERGGVAVIVQLPATGYVQSQMVHFTAQVENSSNITVQEVQFRIVQAFSFVTKNKTKTVDVLEGQTYAIIDSSVISGNEKTWELELRIPPDMYNGCLDACTVLKSSVELRGEIILPLPHKNLHIEIPLILGNVPLANTMM